MRQAWNTSPHLAFPGKRDGFASIMQTAPSGRRASDRPEPRAPGSRPTPIPISRGMRNLIIIALVGALGLILWLAPIVLVVALGGFAIAMVLSVPVRYLSRIMPRVLAITLAFLILLAAFMAAAYVFVPLVISQIGALREAAPLLIDRLERLLVRGLAALGNAGFLERSPDEIAANLGDRLTTGLGTVTGNLLGDAMGWVIGTVSFTLTLFAALIVAAMLLASAREIKASYLRTVPPLYRFDARELWDDLAHALTRYLGGLGLVLLIQGALSAVALYLIGVPYPLALGAWVSITAVIPYIGAWIGAIPALLVALSVSPTALVLTALTFLAIQQVEGNFLTPRIQGQTIRVPSVIIFLAVVAGGALFGLLGVLFAVPMLAVLRVVFDFFRARLRVVPPRPRRLR